MHSELHSRGRLLPKLCQDPSFPAPTVFDYISWLTIDGQPRKLRAKKLRPPLTHAPRFGVPCGISLGARKHRQVNHSLAILLTREQGASITTKSHKPQAAPFHGFAPSAMRKKPSVHPTERRGENKTESERERERETATRIWYQAREI